MVPAAAAATAVIVGSAMGMSVSGLSAGAAELVPTRTAVASTPNPSRAGTEVTISAAVESLQLLHPEGSVTFSHNGTPIAAVALDRNGQAAVSAVLARAGTHRLGARYDGSMLFAQSRATVSHDVEAAAPPPTTTPPSTTLPPPTTSPSPTGVARAVPTTPPSPSRPPVTSSELRSNPAPTAPTNRTALAAASQVAATPRPTADPRRQLPPARGQRTKGEGADSPQPAGVPALVAAIPSPARVVASSARLVTVGLLSVLVLAYIGFLTAMFNQTFEEYYDRIRRARAFDRGQLAARWRWPAFGAYAVGSAIILSWVDPGFGFNRSSSVLAAGLAVAIVVVSLITGAAFAVETRFRLGQRAPLRLLAAAFPVLATCAVVSRAAGFLPGIAYGVIASYTTPQTRAAMGERRRGQLVAISGAATLLVSILAWVAWWRVHGRVQSESPSWPLVVTDAALAGVFLLGLTGTVFRLMPIRPFAGARLFAWSKGVWAGLEGLAIFGFVLVALTPSRPEVRWLNTAGAIGLVVLLAGFSLVSVGLWAWFRVRPAPSCQIRLDGAD